MSIRPAQEPAVAAAPVFEEPDAGRYVYLCHRCGEPLEGPNDLCNRALHVGSDGLGIGRAVRSSELARLASAARAALGSTP